MSARLKASITLLSLFAVCLIAAFYNYNQEIEYSQNQTVMPSPAQARALNDAMFESPVERAIPSAKSDSLSGTDIQKSFIVDEAGNLRADLALREFFDYYLSTLGEHDLKAIIGNIQATIHQSLNEPARSQALSILKNYIDYKIDLETFNEQATEAYSHLFYIELVQETHSALHEFRLRYFSQEIYEAFFAREDIQNNVVIEQIKVRQNDNLTEEQKIAALQRLDEMLPEDIRQTRYRSTVHSQLNETVDELRNEGANENEIYQVRQTELGAEAANALAELDQQRAVWRARLNEFKDKKETILDSTMSQYDKEQQINFLLESEFSVSERKRVSALVADGRI